MNEQNNTNLYEQLLLQKKLEPDADCFYKDYKGSPKYHTMAPPVQFIMHVYRNQKRFADDKFIFNHIIRYDYIDSNKQFTALSDYYSVDAMILWVVSALTRDNIIVKDKNGNLGLIASDMSTIKLDMLEQLKGKKIMGIGAAGIKPDFILDNKKYRSINFPKGIIQIPEEESSKYLVTSFFETEKVIFNETNRKYYNKMIFLGKDGQPDPNINDRLYSRKLFMMGGY